MADSITTLLITVLSIFVLVVVLIYPLMLMLTARVARAFRVPFWKLVIISVLSVLVSLAAAAVLEETVFENLELSWALSSLIDLILLCIVGVPVTKLVTKADLKRSAVAFVPAAILFSIFLEGAWALFTMDAELRPEIVELAQPQEIQRPENNLFEAMLGFCRDPHSDLLATGRKIVDEENERAKRGDFYSGSKSADYDEDGKSKPDELDERLEGREDIWKLEPEDLPVIETALEQNRAVLESYKSLRSFDTYKNTLLPTPKGNLPGRTYSAMYGAKLVRLDIARSFVGRDFERASRELDAELGVWMRVWNSSETFWMRPIAGAALGGLLALYMDMLDSSEFLASPFSKAIDLAHAHPLDLSSEDLAERIIRGRATGWAAMSDADLEEGLTEAELMERMEVGVLPGENRAANRIFEQFSLMKDRVSEPLDNYVTMEESELAPQAPLGARPAGLMTQFFADLDLQSLESEHLFGGKVACTLRLAKAKELLRRNSVPFKDVGTYLQDLPAELKNPWTLDPLEWSLGERRLRCKGKGDSGKHVRDVFLDDLRAMEGE